MSKPNVGILATKDWVISLINKVIKKGFNGYSTDEKRIGTWVDGRPVYRKVVPVTLPSKEGNTSTPHGISNMDTLVNYSLTWYDILEDAWYDRFRLRESTYGVAMEMNINRTNILIITNKTNNIDWRSRTSKAYSILEYTKTS